MKDIGFYAVQLISVSNDPSVQDIRHGTGCIIRSAGRTEFHFFLVSNKHVIYPFDELTIKTDFETYRLPYPDYKCLCHCHDKDIDLAIVCIDKLMEADLQEHHDLSARAIPADNILSKLDVLSLTSASGIISASVPNHLRNDRYSYPIVRKGIIASPPEMTVKDSDELLADIACFPSYSGSPVFLESSSDNGWPQLIGIEKKGPLLDDVHFMHIAILQCAYKILDLINCCMINNR